METRVLKKQNKKKTTFIIYLCLLDVLHVLLILLQAHPSFSFLSEC